MDVIWWSAVSLEAVVLVRGVFAGLFKRYPFFYTYVGCVLLKEIVGLLSIRFAPRLYVPWYWPAELTTIVASYAVLIEIFRQTFSHNQKAVRLTRDLLLVLFFFTFFYIGFDLLRLGFAYLPRAIVELGRDLRYIEGALLLVMLLALALYRVSIERDLLGLVAGYSFWIGVNVMNLAFWFQPGKELSPGLRKLIPVSYVVTLILWCVSLWSSKPEQIPPSRSETGQGHEVLAAETKAALSQMSAHVTRTLRQ